MKSIHDRARAYLARMPVSVSGQGGHAAAFAAALTLTKGFNLGEQDALPLLMEWNGGCLPPWSEADLRHKLRDAAKSEKPDGYLLKGNEHSTQPTRQPPAPKPPKPRLDLAAFHRGTNSEIEALAKLRRLDHCALAAASGLGTLAFGNVCGFPSWIITDDARRIAEGRRMDGLKYPKIAALEERKAHTLKGSSKSWPAGVAVLRKMPQFDKIMIVEGGPDYLAAFHFLVANEEWHTLPVAVLGRGAGRAFDPDAVELLRGKRVRIYPHADDDGEGMAGAQIWAAQLHAAGCQVDFFDLADLTRRDGKPVNDLNDAALIDPKQNPEIANLLP